jgi:hypothetical protein
VLDWMTSVAPEKLVASTWAEPRWTVTAAGDQRPARKAGRPRAAHGAAGGPRRACTSGGVVSGASGVVSGAPGVVGGVPGGVVGGGDLSLTAAAP